MHYKLGSFYANKRLEKLAYDPERDAFSVKSINRQQNPYEGVIRPDIGQNTWGSYFNSLWDLGAPPAINPFSSTHVGVQGFRDAQRRMVALRDLQARTFGTNVKQREDLLKNIHKSNARFIGDNAARGSAADLMAGRNSQTQTFTPSDAFKSYQAAARNRINMVAGNMGAQVINQGAPPVKPAAPQAPVTPPQAPAAAPTPVPSQPPAARAVPTVPRVASAPQAQTGIVPKPPSTMQYPAPKPAARPVVTPPARIPGRQDYR